MVWQVEQTDDHSGQPEPLPLSWSIFNILRVLALGVDTERSLSADLGDISKAHARGKQAGARTSHEG